MNLTRHLRRLVLRRRAVRVARERQYRDLDQFLEAIRAERADQPPWQRRHADD